MVWSWVRFLECSGFFCIDFVCSPDVCVGSLWMLQLPPAVQRPATYVNWLLCITVRINTEYQWRCNCAVMSGTSNTRRIIQCTLSWTLQRLVSRCNVVPMKQRVIFFQVLKGAWVSGLCVWPLDCEKYRPFEAFGFWNRESGQMKPNVVSALSACRCLGRSGSSAPLLPLEPRIRWIFPLNQDVASCWQKQFKGKMTESMDGGFSQRESRRSWMVIYSFSPWQLRIIKWGEKREPKSLTWALLAASYPVPHVIESSSLTSPGLFSSVRVRVDVVT